MVSLGGVGAGDAFAENNPKMSSSIFCSASRLSVVAGAAVSGSATVVSAEGGAVSVGGALSVGGLGGFSLCCRGDFGGGRLGDFAFGDNGLRLISAPAFLFSKGTDIIAHNEKNETGSTQTHRLDTGLNELIALWHIRAGECTGVSANYPSC